MLIPWVPPEKAELFMRGKNLEWWEEGAGSKRQHGLGFGRWSWGVLREQSGDLGSCSDVRKTWRCFSGVLPCVLGGFPLVSLWEISLKRWSCYLLIGALLGAKMGPKEARGHTYFLLSWLIAVSIWIPYSSAVNIISNFPAYICIML